MFNRREVVMGIGGSILASTPVLANTRDLNMIVGIGPGGSSDTSSRILGRFLNESNINTTITNRPAGSGIEAVIHVMNLPPRPETLLSTGINAILIGPRRERLPYDSDTLAPVCMFSTAAFVIAVKSNSPYRTIQELLNAGRQSPGISISCGGGETAFTADSIALAYNARNVTIVAYRSGADAARDLLAGVVDAAYVSVAGVAGMAKSGDVRLLAHNLVDGGTIAEYPDVPHIFSIGSTDPKMLNYGYHALYSARNLSQEFSQSITSEIQKICNDRRFIEEHTSRGMTVSFKGPEELRQHNQNIIRDFVGPYMRWIETRR